MLRALLRLCSPGSALHSSQLQRFVRVPSSLPPKPFAFFPAQRGPLLYPPKHMEPPEEKSNETPTGGDALLFDPERLLRTDVASADESIIHQGDTQKKTKGGRLRRRSKSVTSETLDDLLAELPFANVDSKDAFDHESITQQQGDNQRKMKGSKRRRRSKSVKSDTLDSLLAELPFANVDNEDAFGFTAKPDKGSLKNKRKRTLELEHEDQDPKKKKEKKSKPNYFVALPVKNQKILDNIQTLQDTVVQKEHRLSKAMIPQGSLHLTLFVMHLANEEEINLAVCALTETKSLVDELLHGRPLVLSFQGISEFRNAVVFVRLKEGDPAEATLTMITKTMMKLFNEKGILIGKNSAFTPHLTFMKLSKSPKLRKQGLKKIDPSLYKDFKNHYFGDENVNNLDLCSMLKKKQPNGYYHCEGTVTIGKKPETESIKNALRRESLALLSKLNQIKELLSAPQTRANIYREVFGVVSSCSKSNQDGVVASTFPHL